jgi:hypothetical protein
MHDAVHEIDALNDLLEHMADSFENYQEAEAKSTDPTLVEFFQRGVTQRRRLICVWRQAVQAWQTGARCAQLEAECTA